MANLADELLLEILQAIEASAPQPFYPAAFAAHAGLERHVLDEALDHLRLRGLVGLTDWAQGKGQGYALTDQGARVLQNPALLKRARLPAAEPALAPPEDRPESAWARGEAVRETLLNPARPVVCMTLLAVNILMFAVGLFLALRQGATAGEYLGNSSSKVVNEIRDELGALNPSEVVLKNQWWRLLAHIFVHGGLLHLILNMYFLYSLGPLLETMWGSLRFLVLYLVGAVTSACAVMLTMRTAVGASGALCGLLTSLGVWVYLNRRSLPPRIVSDWTRSVFINIFLIVLISTVPRVSWEGHLGGALGGALVSVPLNYQRFGRGWQKVLGLAGVIAVPLLCLSLVVYEYWDPLKVRWFLYPPFSAAEMKAVTVYNEYAVPLLNDWRKDKDIDKTRLDAGREAFLETHQQLQTTIERFDKASLFRSNEVESMVHKRRTYLQEWAKYYSHFTKLIELPFPWPEEQVAALSRQKQNVMRTLKGLGDSPLLPSPYRETQ